MKLDRVIISVNDDPAYYRCWPLTAMSWHRWFPEVEIFLGFVTRRYYEDPLIKRMMTFGRVGIFVPQSGISTVNQSRVLRHYLAARLSGLNMIHDVDSVILQREYVEGLLRHAAHSREKLLAVGRDVLIKAGVRDNFPMGYATATRGTWEEIIGVRDDTTWHRFVLAQKGLPGRADIGLPPITPANAGRRQAVFCDECWIQERLRRCNVAVSHVNAAHCWKDILTVRGKLDVRRLESGGYIELHHHLPIERYQRRLRTIAAYLGIADYKRLTI